MRFSSLFRPFHCGLFCYPTISAITRPKVWQTKFKHIFISIDRIFKPPFSMPEPYRRTGGRQFLRDCDRPLQQRRRLTESVSRRRRIQNSLLRFKSSIAQMKRGRRTLLNAKLQKQICGYLSDCCTIRTACEASGISETSFFEWIRRGEAGERPFAQFTQAVTRARGRAKARIVRSLLDEKDWRPRLEMLARVFPDEYGRRDIVPLPTEPASPMPPMTLVLSMNGEKRETTFEEAERIFCGHFPRRDEPPEDESEPGNGDAIDIGPRFKSLSRMARTKIDEVLSELDSRQRLAASIG